LCFYSISILYMTLTPVLSSNVTPPNVAWQNSWVNVSNDQNRPLFAQASYLTNASDLNVSLSATNINIDLNSVVTQLNTIQNQLNQQLGQNGFVITNANDTTQYDGNFTTFQTLTTTRFAGLTTTSPQTIGNGITTIDLPVGFVFNGPVTNFKLQYGAVIAYKA